MRPIANPVDKWRVEINGYLFDRRIFLSVTIGIALLFLLLWAGTGFKTSWAYAACPADSLGPCPNPFLDELGSCAVENTLLCDFAEIPPAWSIGEKIPRELERFPVSVFLLVSLAFLANHLFINGVLSRWLRKK